MASARVYRYLVLLFAASAVVAAACSDPVATRLVLEPVPGHECPAPDPETPPDPECVMLAKGESVIVHAFYERAGVREPVGSEVKWISNLPSIAQVTGGGSEVAITGVDRGGAVVTASAKPLQNGIKVMVTAPDITSISIDPPSVNVPAGLQTQLTATARLVDGDTMPVTHLVTWVSSDPNTATIDQTGEVTGRRPGNVNITATLGELEAIGAVNVTQPRLTAITLAPANPSIPLGGTQQLAAMGTFTDGSMRDVSNTVTWSSAQPGVASVSIAGVVTGNVLGSTMISAQQSNVRGSTMVTVTAPVLATIAVTPLNPSLAAGQAQQFVATGTLTDGTTTNLTAMATWSSTAMGVATISNMAGSQGRATSVAPGMTTIRATMGAVTGETMLTVTPAVLASIAVNPASVSVALGRTQQFTATGTMTNGVMMPMTTTVTWSSTMPGIASVSNAAGSQGLATTLAAGPTQIVATSGVISGSATLSVGAPALQTITVLPADGTVAIGATRQMRAIGGMSDGSTPDITNLVTWGTSMPGRATITAAGLARGVSLGATTITATQGMVSGMTTLTVTPVELVSITVTPAMPAVTAGQTQQFTATGRYTDDTMANLTASVTWTSGTPAVATISNQGLATTLSGGTSTITAAMGMISGSTTLTSNAVTVAAFSPADGASSLRPVTPISITFSQAMNPASLFGQLMAGPCGGNIQLSLDDFQSCLPFTTVQPAMSAGDTVATLVPATPLRALTRYRVRVTSSVRSTANIPMTADVTLANGFVIASDGPCAADLVISQVYGGGGDSGAPILHDFIELHNPGPVAVDLGGKAVQFLDAAGNGAWAVQALPSVQLAPGGYFLIREAAGAGAQPALANPDFTPMSPFAMGATSGKVALTASTVPLAGACPIGLTLDLVGYGGTASCFEGNAPVAAPDNTTGVVRATAGCGDLNLETDFSVAAPAPRNAMSAPSVCVCYVNETDLQAEVDTCTLTFPTLANGPAPLTIAVFGRVFEAGVTEGAGAAPVVRMSFGFGVGESSPTGWPWLDGVFNQAVGTNDEYRQQLTFPMAGDFDYTSRATRDGTNWTICDIDGAGSVGQLRFDQFQTGAATITP